MSLALLMLSSCAQLPEDNAQAATKLDLSQIKTWPLPAKYDPAIGKPGNMRIISSVSLPKTFNAYLASETSSTDVIGQMYLGMVTTNAVTKQIEPQLAESWTLSPDKRTYVFKLREGLKWSDGQPITADDVVFTYNDIMDNKDIPNNYRDGLVMSDEKGEDHFPEVKKIDDQHVSFTTYKPFVPFLRGLGDPIMPKHVFQGTTVPGPDKKVKFNQMWGLDSNVKDIVVNGPWKIADYRVGQWVSLEPNPYYYQKDKQGNQLPYLKKFITIEVQDQSTEIIKFMAGETDSLSLRPEDYDALEPLQKQGKFTIANLGPATGTLFVMFNMSTATTDKGKPVVNPIKSAWFRNKLFRQAMAYAIDKEGMIQSIYKGRAMPQFSHISQQNPFYKPTTKDYPYDLDKAKKTLEEAGFRLKGDTLYDSKGNRVEFNLVTNSGNTMRDAACAILRRDWGKLGIKVNYQPVNFNIMVQQIDQTLDWEAMMIGLTGSAIEPHSGINSWKLDGSMHMFNMGNPKSGWKGQTNTTYEPWEREVLDLYQKASVEFDFEKRKALYWKAQDLVSENEPFIYTVNSLSLVSFRDNLGNIFPSIHGGSALNVINWNTDAHFIQE